MRNWRDGAGRQGSAGVLVIHGLWAHDGLCLWAEQSPGDGPPGARNSPVGADAPSDVQPGREDGRPHPFAARHDAIADVLAASGDGPVASAEVPAASAEVPAASGDVPATSDSALIRDITRKAVERELDLWLPAARGAPQASPELIGAMGATSGVVSAQRAALGCWQVPALWFEAGAAAAALGALDKPVALGTGASAELSLGSSVAYWSATARFAADLAERGRVLPALTATGGGWEARWRAILTGDDGQWAGELTGAMPPLCRATQPRGAQPAAVMAVALNALTDAAVRTRLEGGSAGQPGFRLLPAKRGRRSERTGIAERWCAALTGPEPKIAVSGQDDEADAAALAGALAEWHDAAQAPGGPARACFRLIEPDPGPGAETDPEAETDAETDPEAEPQPKPESEPQPKPESEPQPEPLREPSVPEPESGGSWRVEFALQSTDDPSLLLSAAHIWEGTGTWAPGGIGHPDEELLAGLGSAARLFPELDEALRTAEPAGLDLDTAGAFRFLKETGPLLAGAGFGVLLPDWARKARLGLKLTSRSRAATDGAGGAVRAAAFGLNDLVDFRYELAVGDASLDPDELAELARLKVPLVRIRGQWVELDEANLRAALRFMEGGQAGMMRAGDAMLAGLRGPDDDLPVVGVDADGWLGDLLSGQAERQLAPVPVPRSFHGGLRPYQERGLAWLAFLANVGLGGILADDMGLGKGVMMLALLAHEKESRAAQDSAAGGPTLLVCPMSLVGNWQREAERFTPELSVHVHHGADRLTGDDLTGTLGAADLVLTTYAVAARDAAGLARVPWHRVVCDEAQNIKNAGTRQARAVRGLPAASRVALTGTPVENRLAELWSIMEFTTPGLLGTAEKFRSSFAVPVERHGDEDAADRLKRITGPFILRRVKTDKAIISDLPDKIEMKVWCNLTAEQASLYQATVTDMMAKIEEAQEGIERRGLVLATMAKLKQACNHPAHLLGDGSRLAGRSGKLARLEEICDEVLAEGDKALCFTQYAEFGSQLQPYLAARLGCPVLYLHGGTPKKTRDALVADFQCLTEPAVFLLSLKAGGTGLNLTAASHVIHFDRWWNPAVEDQATDRAFRIGQRKDVQVRKFVCVGTLEERIDAMLEEKKALADRVMGTGESWLTELSDGDLREVLALSPDAVSA
ncbi:MAG TPA: SNF2-related protein [Streptosporangiaceae bacterium]|nr:SNF2-related protein [Streptosporangiaceae bacterium]